MNKNELKKIAVVSMFCAVAFLCVFLFKFKISFLTFDFKDAFLSIISFIYGPFYGVISSVIVAFFEFLSVSDTGLYGFLMNAISSAVFASTCGFLYKYNHTFKGAISGAITAVISMTIVMIIANYIITPFYMGVERSQVVDMIPTLLLPFNVIKGAVNMAITLIIYKPITSALKRTGLIVSPIEGTNKKKFLGLTIISIVLIIICVIAIFFIFDGSFELYQQ